MDKKSIIGFVLILAVLTGYFYLSRPSEEEMAEMRRQHDSLVQLEVEKAQRAAQADSLLAVQSQPTDVAHGLDSIFRIDSVTRDFTLTNDKLCLTISSLGASIQSAQVRGFHTWNGDSLYLFQGAGNGMSLRFFARGIPVSTDGLNFSLVGHHQAQAQGPGDTARLVLQAQTRHGGALRIAYALGYGSHIAKLRMSFLNMDGILASNIESVDLEWRMTSPRQEKNPDKELEYTRLSYRLANDDFEELSAREEEEKENVRTKLRWVGFKEQFFSAFLINPNDFLQADLRIAPVTDDLSRVSDFSANFLLPYHPRRAQTHYDLELYMGPNHYKTLKSYDYGLEEVVPLGSLLVGWVNSVIIINVFDWLDNRIASYGLIILLLTILIKLLIFPLTYKSYKSQAKMRVLKPLVDEVNEKYPRKEDAVKKQQAVMAIYKRAGVSPMGGCLPMFIQFPILIAMFRFFPASFELRQKSFLWAEDLSSYDSILDLPFSIPFYGDHVSLFTLLMAVSMFLSSWLSFKQTASAGPQMPGMKFMMLYLMPIMMMLWFNNYSSALSYYYFLSMCITIIQTLLIRHTVNEKALFERLQRNAQTTKGKPKRSSFMERMERMQREQMRKAEEMKRLQQQNRKRR